MMMVMVLVLVMLYYRDGPAGIIKLLRTSRVLAETNKLPEAGRGEANKYMNLERRACVCFNGENKTPKPAQV